MRPSWPRGRRCCVSWPCIRCSTRGHDPFRGPQGRGRQRTSCGPWAGPPPR
jgi:hypothetical protein